MAIGDFRPSVSPPVGIHRRGSSAAKRREIFAALHFDMWGKWPEGFQPPARETVDRNSPLSDFRQFLPSNAPAPAPSLPAAPTPPPPVPAPVAPAPITAPSGGDAAPVVDQAEVEAEAGEDLVQRAAGSRARRRRRGRQTTSLLGFGGSSTSLL